MFKKTQILSIAILVSLGFSSAFAKEETTVTPVKKISDQQVQEITDAGVGVLKHIAEARGNIHDKKYSMADENLNQAQTLVDIIQADLPTFRVKNRISVAQKHLDYEDVEQVTPDLVPIYADLSFLESYVPTAQARAHLDKAKESLKKGDKKTAQNEFRLAGEALTYREVDLPVTQTEKSIQSAKLALSQKKYDQADKDLKLAEQSVQMTENVITGEPKKMTGSSTTNSNPASDANSNPAPSDSTSTPSSNP